MASRVGTRTGSNSPNYSPGELWNPTSESVTDDKLDDTEVLSLKKDLHAHLEEDSVGDTVYSKSWLLSLLVEAVDFVNKNTTTSARGVPRSPGDGNHIKMKETVTGNVQDDVSSVVQELDEKTEQSMCKLWDCSVNKDVARFLAENKSVDLLLEVADRSQSPRLTEICIGIVGNVVCCKDICEGLFDEEAIRKIVGFLGSSDPQVIFETLRLVQSCLTHSGGTEMWKGSITSNKEIEENLQFILQSSTVAGKGNGIRTGGYLDDMMGWCVQLLFSPMDVLAQVGSFLDLAMTLYDCLLHQWCSVKLLRSILVAVQEIKQSSDVSRMRSFIAVIESFSSFDGGVQVLEANLEEVSTLLSWYIVEEVGMSDGNCCHGDHAIHFQCGCSVLLFLQTHKDSKDNKGDWVELVKALHVALQSCDVMERSNSNDTTQNGQGSHLERAITHLKNGSVRETISSLNEFNAKNKSTFKFQESEFQRKAFCKLALSKLSEDHDTSQDVTVDDWNTLSSSLLTTLRLLTRENVGTEELASECGLRSVLVKAELSKRPPEAIGCDRPGPEVEVIVESLKCLCNLVLNNRSLSRLCCELGVLQGLIERLEGQSYVLSKDICVFDIKLLFLLTSLHPEARREVRQLHDGLRVLTVLVERTIIAHVKATPDGPNKERKLVQLSSELDNAELSVLSDVFKILFAITMSWHDNEEDFTQAEREICVKLSHLLRILISYLHQGRDATRENTLQCLYDAAMNLPTFCADSFILDGVPEPAAKALLSTTFDGFDMSVVHFTVDFMDCKLQRKEVKTSMSVIGTLRNWSKGHRSIRRYLRSQILPPIGRVTQRPDEGDSVKSRLVQNMAASLFGVEDLISEFLFTLCKEKPPRFIKHVGYGHAAGLLMSRGLLGGGDPPNPSSYSDDSDSDTEEYKQCKESIDPITGGPRKKVSSSFDKLSEHEKEEEIEKLEKALEKLNKGGVFEMVGLDREGHARVIEQTQDKPAARRGSSASSDED